MAPIDTEQLIAEVRSRPLLYQKQHEEYNEPESKQRAWRDVAAAVYGDWESVSRSETYERILLLQKKWRSLRDAFNRELRMRARGGPRSRKKYIYYKPLKFLRQYDASAADRESSSEEDDPLVSAPKAKRQRSRARRKRPSIKHEAVGVDEPDASGDCAENDYAEPAPPAHLDAEPDSDRLFLLSYAEEMRRLPAHVRMWARAQVSRVMQEAVTYCCGGGDDPSAASVSVSSATASHQAPADLDTRSLHSLKLTSEHHADSF